MFLARRRRMRSLPLGRRRSTQAFCAHTVPRWLRLAHSLYEGAAPARGLSPSTRDRDATCQLRSPTPSKCCVSRAAPAHALAAPWEEAQHASFCARAVPRWLRLAYSLYEGAAPARGLSPLAHDRGATCQLQPPTPSKHRESRGAGALMLTVSGEEAQHSRMLRVRTLLRYLWLSRS